MRRRSEEKTERTLYVTETKRIKHVEKDVSQAALTKRKQRLKLAKKEDKIVQIRSNTRERVRKYRENKKIMESGGENVTNASDTVTPFANTMSKCRALLRFKENLPGTPIRRNVVISAYLDSSSPTAKSLLNERKIASHEDVSNIELADCVVNDLKQAIHTQY